jgi:hypothetical protein
MANFKHGVIAGADASQFGAACGSDNDLARTIWQSPEHQAVGTRPMDQKVAMQKAFETLCEAIQQLERSVTPVANPRLLRACAKLRRKADTMMSEILHPRQRDAATRNTAADRKDIPR